MRLIHLILLLLLAIFALLVSLLLSGNPEGATGMPHGQFTAMTVGGDGLARLGGMGWAICAIQVLTILLIHCLVALGINERHRSSAFWMLLGSSAVISLVIWMGMYLSYIRFLETGGAMMVLGYPLPTALAMFGVFLGGSYLCVIYIWGFRRFIYPEEDEAAYEALRAHAAQPRKPDAPHGGSDA
ncbi:MAG: hypothetical protein EP301_12010 [Gammaproteobacteria bacterium]|nr:MAG: hypothetical protein EP301_12010 [Gammaproteobacteria bacterium]